MGIQHLHITGFRSLHDVEWRPGNLNVVIGPNGSGKSNLLRALELLSHSAHGRLSNELIASGGIGAVLWDGSAEHLGWSVDADVPADYRDTTKRSILRYELLLDRHGFLSDYRVEKEILTDEGLNDYERRPIKYIQRTNDKAFALDDFHEKLKEIETKISNEESVLSVISWLGANDIIFLFQDYLKDWRLFHDIEVGRNAIIRQAPVARHVSQLAPDGQNLVPVLHTLYTSDREFKRAIDDAMRAAFGGEYEELVFGPAADQRIQLRLRWRSLQSDQPAADLSDGTLRFLLLAAILASPNPGSLIAFDEPETGLHPSMFPIIAEMAVEASRRTQVIFTTHSPEFLAAFTETIPTTTVAEWVDGKTALSVLAGDDLKAWLADYSLGAAFRTGELEAQA